MLASRDGRKDRERKAEMQIVGIRKKLLLQMSIAAELEMGRNAEVVSRRRNAKFETN